MIVIRFIFERIPGKLISDIIIYIQQKKFTIFIDGCCILSIREEQNLNIGLAVMLNKKNNKRIGNNVSPSYSLLKDISKYNAYEEIAYIK